MGRTGLRFAILCAVVVLTSEVGRAVVVQVTPSTPNGWASYLTDDSGTIGTGSGTAGFVTGPSTPPLGVGSFHLMTPAGGGDQSVQLRNSSFAGTRVDSLTTLSYSTHATAWNGSQLPYLTLWLDLDGNGSRDDRLWFEPTYSSAGAGNGNPNPQPNVALNQWQTWDALNGMWYSDNVAGPGANAITLAAYLAAPGNGNATIINDAGQGIGGIRIATGFAGAADNFNAYVDNFSIGTVAGVTTFDFEPAAVPEASSILFGALVCSASGGMFLFRRRRAKS
jgi:hypothetical protein